MNAERRVAGALAPEKARSRQAVNEEVREQKRHHDELLDEALKETFPASDPISIYLPDDHMILEEAQTSQPVGR